MSKIRLFICHASEDKPEFVRPLAKALRSEFAIWYDEFELTIGDSLLNKVNRGLAECDYGVVVLSHSFFQKKWPQAELDGLFALEDTTRKIILPVWKGVTAEDVKKYSPILAGRIGADAADGIEKVVNEIRRAVGVSNRTREISTANSIFAKAHSIDLSMEEKQNATRLSNSPAGAAIVSNGFTDLYSAIESMVHDIGKQTTNLHLSIQKNPNPGSKLEFVVLAGSQLGMNICMVGLGGDFTTHTELVVVLYNRTVQPFGFPARADQFGTLKFKPTFRLPRELVWQEEGTARLHTNGGLRDYLLETLMKEIDRRNQ